MKVNEYIANVLSEYQNIFTVSGAGNLYILDEIKDISNTADIINETGENDDFIDDSDIDE